MFFAFDGTGDDKGNVTFGTPSNVARLYESAKSGLTKADAGDAFHYKGPGTQDNSIMRVIDGATGMTVPNTVKTAYDQLVEYANANPNVTLSIGTTGFSRGAATARIFLNAVWEEGIPDTSSRVTITDANGLSRVVFTKYLVEPQKADLAIAMLYDTVGTGISNKELMRIPPAAGLQVYQLGAIDEHRSLFKFDSILDPNNPFDSRLRQEFVAGAHHDVGGGAYAENGIGLYTLDIGYQWLKNSGIPLGPLPAELTPGSQRAVIHDSFKGFHGPEAGPGAGGYVYEPRWEFMNSYSNPAYVIRREVQNFADGSKWETLTLSDNSSQVITRNSTWQIEQVTTTSVNSDGSRKIVEADKDGKIFSTTIRKIDDAGNIRETITKSDGSIIRRETDFNGNVKEMAVDTGAQNFATALSATASFLTLVQAIQSGKPLPIVGAGINTLAAVNPGKTVLTGASAAVGAIASLVNLQKQIQKGDAAGSLVAGANLVSYGASAGQSMPCPATRNSSAH